MKKDPITGTWKEITLKKSLSEKDFEIQYAEEEARSLHKLKQKKLSEDKQRKIKERQLNEKKKIIVGKIQGVSLISKMKRLKKLYINGTLNKHEFEQAKNKVLK